jgi:uridine kinase
MPLLDLSIFVDIDDGIALRRRILRDTIERGRSEASVIEQFKYTVLPANKKYIRPSAKAAQLQFSGNAAIDQSVACIMDQVQILRYGRQ